VSRRLYELVFAAIAFVLVATGGVVAPTATSLAAVPSSRETTAAGSHHVTLITGDIVTLSLSPDGHQRASVLRQNSTDPGRQFQIFNIGSDLYVVPQSAVPYLGSTIDLALFDITKLAQAPVSAMQITLRSNAASVALPGIRITHRSGTTAQGTVAPTSGGAFGAALGRQWLADHGSPTHASGLFTSIVRIAASSTPPVVQPHFVMHTLTINGIDPVGRKDTGDAVLVVNVDDLNRYDNSSVLVNGRANVSVPTGHYLALTFYADPASGTVHVVEAPQIAVTRNTAVTLDGRKATSRVSVTTSKSAAAVVSDLTIGRTDATGVVDTITLEGETGATFYVQPTTKPVTVGALHYSFYTRLLSPSGVTKPYTYDLKFFSDDVIPTDQHYVVHDRDLAAVDSKYAASHADQQAYTATSGALFWDPFELEFTSPLIAPTQRTEYYTASPALLWQSTYISVFLPSGDALGDYTDAARSYSQGDRLSTTWGAPPGHPTFDTGSDLAGQVLCPACISGDRVDLAVLPFSDSAPSHFGSADGSADGLTESLAYTVFADDVSVASGDFLETDMTVPSDTKRLRIEFDTARSSPDFLLSTAVQTRWTVPTAAPTTGLPAGWRCTDFPDPPSECSVLPLTIANYQLPVDLLGQLGSGARTGRLHLSQLGRSASVPFNSVKISVSYDDEKTWTAVPIAGQGGGDYRLALNVPAANGTDGFGALRISTRDAFGATFEQTIQHAFAIATQ